MSTTTRNRLVRATAVVSLLAVVAVVAVVLAAVYGPAFTVEIDGEAVPRSAPLVAPDPSAAPRLGDDLVALENLREVTR